MYPSYQEVLSKALDKHDYETLIPYNGHVLTDTTKHETLAKFEKWS
jgi:hypothetical protein